MSESYRNLQHPAVNTGTIQATGSDLIWKICNFVSGVFFTSAAAVQYNDPDPFIWIAVYSVPGVAGFLLTFLPLHLIIRYGFAISASLGLHLVACMCGGVVLASMSLQQIGKLTNPLAVEEGRELCGLIIVSMWIFLTVVFIQRKQNMLFVYVSNRSMALFACFAVFMALIPPLLWSFCLFNGLAPKLSYCAEMAKSCGEQLDVSENITAKSEYR